MLFRAHEFTNELEPTCLRSQYSLPKALDLKGPAGRLPLLRLARAAACTPSVTPFATGNDDNVYFLLFFISTTSSADSDDDDENDNVGSRRLQ